MCWATRFRDAFLAQRLHSARNQVVVGLFACLAFVVMAEAANPRAFSHSVTPLGPGEVQVVFLSPSAAAGQVPTRFVRLHYRIGSGALQSVVMTPEIAGQDFRTTLSGLETGNRVDYYFTHGLSGLTQIMENDTAWFTYTVGTGPGASPSFPLNAVTAGRFRRAQERNALSSHTVEGTQRDRFKFEVFTVEVEDSGTGLTVILETDPEVELTECSMLWHDRDGNAHACNSSSHEGRIDFVEQPGRYFVFELNQADFVLGQEVDFSFQATKNDPAGTAYYTEVFRYRIGEGKFAAKHQHPWARSAGGVGVSHVADRRLLFSQHINKMTLNTVQTFLRGKVFFDTNWLSGGMNDGATVETCDGPVELAEKFSPDFFVPKAGPLLNATSCFACHVRDGRGRPPLLPNEPMTSMVLRVSIPGTDPVTGGPNPHPVYGAQLRDKDVNGGTGHGWASVSWETLPGQFADGTPYELVRPQYQFHDLADEPIDGQNVLYSGRVAQQLYGIGLLDAVSNEEILSRADPEDLDEDGISGRANIVWNQEGSATALGRYGWKAEQPSLRMQAAAAAKNDMGITSQFFPDGSGNPPEFNNDNVSYFAQYLQTLSPPPNENWRNPVAIRGKEHFFAANCHSCHAPVLPTSSSYPVHALRNLKIQPFTDLLLHDMGPGLSDNRPAFEASGSEWRTPPLWGLGLIEEVNGHSRLLHDGRARNVMEAILWHGGEAEASKQHVLGLTAREREELLAYLRYPFVDPDAATIEAGQGYAGVDPSDPDGDAKGTSLEEFLGTNPEIPDPSPVLLYWDGAQLNFRYTRNKQFHAADFWVEWSEELQTWHRDGIQSEILSETETLEHVSVTLTGTAPSKAFFRLRFRP